MVWWLIANMLAYVCQPGIQIQERHTCKVDYSWLSYVNINIFSNNLPIVVAYQNLMDVYCCACKITLN